MKKPRRWFAYLLLLVFSLAVGGWLGYRLGKAGEAPHTPDQVGVIPGTARADQRSLLVIGVDRVDSAEARLQGVWYIVYRQNSPRVTLIPLYPALPESDSLREEKLRGAFRLRSDGGVDPSLFSTIRDLYSMSWDAYVLLDDIAMMEIVDFFGGVSVDEESISGPIAVGGIPRAWEDPSSAVLGQASLIEKLCRQVTYNSTPKNYEKILSLIPEHFRSEMTTDQAFSDWLGLLSASTSLQCEFPSLTSTAAP